MTRTYNFIREEFPSLPASGLNFEGVDGALQFVDMLLPLGVGVAISSSSLETSIAVVVKLLPLFLGVEFRTELNSTSSDLIFFLIESFSGFFLLTLSTRRAKKK